MHYFLLELAQQDILIEREKQLAAELSTIPSINEIRIDIGQITLI